MKKISVITVARSDFGHYMPVLRQIQEDPDLRLSLIVSGMHLSPEFGMTVSNIEEEGFRVDHKVEMLLSSDTPEGISKSIGLGTIGFAQVYTQCKPDIIVVLGDRFEMYSAVLAALPFKIPIAHIEGGAVTEGAIDDALRHSITKMSHIHFVSTKEYARRVIQMGEEPDRVHVTGSPTLDNLHQIRLLSRDETQSDFELKLPEKFLLVTYHPVTLEYENVSWQVKELLYALEKSHLHIIFTMPNCDTGGYTIRNQIREFAKNNPYAQIIENLGTQGYFSIMSLATAMIGNSSSGLVETPSFKLPVVNIGNRQKGKVRCSNVIDVGYSKDEIYAGIQTAISPEFKEKTRSVVNLYGDGHAAGRIVSVLKEITLNQKLLIKSFVDHVFEFEQRPLNYINS